MKRPYVHFILPALVVVLVDQVSKRMIASTIRYGESVPVIQGFFNLVHVRNRGMAFGLMNRPDSSFGYYFLVSAVILAILLIILWFSRLKEGDRSLVFGLSLILGGALGNLIDRLRFKEVTDYLDFFIGSYHWPSFNLADCAITVGAFWIVIHILFSSARKNVRKQ